MKYVLVPPDQLAMILKGQYLLDFLFENGLEETDIYKKSIDERPSTGFNVTPREYIDKPDDYIIAKYPSIEIKGL